MQALLLPPHTHLCKASGIHKAVLEAISILNNDNTLHVRRQCHGAMHNLATQGLDTIRHKVLGAIKVGLCNNNGAQQANSLSSLSSLSNQKRQRTQHSARLHL